MIGQLSYLIPQPPSANTINYESFSSNNATTANHSRRRYPTQEQLFPLKTSKLQHQQDLRCDRRSRGHRSPAKIQQAANARFQQGQDCARSYLGDHLTLRQYNRLGAQGKHPGGNHRESHHRNARVLGNMYQGGHDM